MLRRILTKWEDFSPAAKRQWYRERDYVRKLQEEKKRDQNTGFNIAIVIWMFIILGLISEAIK